MGNDGHCTEDSNCINKTLERNLIITRYNQRQNKRSIESLRREVAKTNKWKRLESNTGPSEHPGVMWRKRSWIPPSANKRRGRPGGARASPPAVCWRSTRGPRAKCSQTTNPWPVFFFQRLSPGHGGPRAEVNNRNARRFPMGQRSGGSCTCVRSQIPPCLFSQREIRGALFPEEIGTS